MPHNNLIVTVCNPSSELIIKQSPVVDPGFGQGGAQLVRVPNFEMGRMYTCFYRELKLRGWGAGPLGPPLDPLLNTEVSLPLPHIFPYTTNTLQRDYLNSSLLSSSPVIYYHTHL